MHDLSNYNDNSGTAGHSIAKKNKNDNTYKDNGTIREELSIDKNHLNSLDPKFKSTIEDFIKVLNNHLNDISISKEQKKLLEKQIEEMTILIREIPHNQKIQQNQIEEPIKSSNYTYNENVIHQDKTIEINPQNAEDYFSKGLSLYYLGSYNEAIACYDKAIEINPEFSYTHNNKGLSLYYLGSYNEAIACYDKAIEINPEFSWAFYNKAQALSTLQRYEEAIPYYDKAIEINPQNADAYYNKAQALSALQRYEEAIPYYDKAIEIESENVDALYKKAWILVNYFPNRVHEASEIIKKAIGLDPTNNDIMHTYGNALDKLKTYEEAILVYEHIIKQKPTFPTVWYDCARSKIKLDIKNMQSCISDLQKAIELDPIYKEKAKYEIDFEEIKNNPDFRKILGL